MATYILADNQPLTHYALKCLLESQGPNTVLEVEDKASLIELLKAADDVVVLLDYTLFDFSDATSLIILADRYPRSEWILISDELTHDLMRHVVYDSRHISIVYKHDELNTIREALRSVSHRQRFICQRATEALLEQRHMETRATPLTATEMEVLRAIAKGTTTREIAAERFSSVHTINTHRKNIFHKLGVNTAYEAIRYALRAGWIEASDFYI